MENYLPMAQFEVHCAHVLEMVGYASEAVGSQRVPPGLPIELPEIGDFLGLLGNDGSSALIERAMEASACYTPKLPVIGLKVPPGAEIVMPVLARSDHAPFWSKGISALMWTDTAEYWNPHYHHKTDLPETLNYQFLVNATKALAATVITDTLRGTPQLFQES